jgi:hypothetical protein
MDLVGLDCAWQQGAGEGQGERGIRSAQPRDARRQGLRPWDVAASSGTAMVEGRGEIGVHVAQPCDGPRRSANVYGRVRSGRRLCGVAAGGAVAVRARSSLQRRGRWDFSPGQPRK